MSRFDDFCNLILDAATVPTFVKGDRAEKDLALGTSYEKLFPIIAKQNDLIAKEAKGKFETEHKIDYMVFEKGTNLPAWYDRSDNQTLKKDRRGWVEVKGPKNNMGPYKLLEFIGTAGYNGWMYGDSNYIAFFNQATEGFDMIKRHTLLKEVEDLGKFTLIGDRKTRNIELVYTSSESRSLAGIEMDDKRNAILVPHKKAIFYTRSPNYLDRCLWVPEDIISKHKIFELNPVR